MGEKPCGSLFIRDRVLDSFFSAYSDRKADEQYRKKDKLQEDTMRRLEKEKQREEWEAEAFFASQEEPEEQEQLPKKPKGREHWLTVIQIAVCALVLLAALSFKLFGGELYTTIRNWYVTHVNQSILTDTDLKNMEQKVWELFPPAPEASSGLDAASSQGASSAASSAPENSSSSASSETASSETSSSEAVSGSSASSVSSPPSGG